MIDAAAGFGQRTDIAQIDRCDFGCRSELAQLLRAARECANLDTGGDQSSGDGAAQLPGSADHEHARLVHVGCTREKSCIILRWLSRLREKLVITYRHSYTIKEDSLAPFLLLVSAAVLHVKAWQRRDDRTLLSAGSDANT